MIQNSRFSPSTGTILITLQLTNFLNQVALSTVRVTISASALIPRVSITGPSIITKYRPQSVSLLVLATLPACAGDVSKSFNYNWKVFDGPVYL